MGAKQITEMNRPVSYSSKEILPNLIHLEFKSQRDLTSTLLRFQEFYESPKFRNKVFNIKEFVSWYRTTKKNGKFSYFTDWAGFNFPSYVLLPFLDGSMGKLTKREIKILKSLKRNGKFYVIGTYKKNKQMDWETKKHEIAHAFYYLIPNYKKQVDIILQDLDCSKIHKYIKKLGYHKDVFVDETHAYLLTDADSLGKAGIELESFSQAQQKLEKNFQRYWKKLVSRNLSK